MTKKSMEFIIKFIERITQIDLTQYGPSENIYRGKSQASQIRQHNLSLYLEQMQALNPSVLLLGEAPGYKGCAVTGIPFTSEQIIACKPFFQQRNYQFIHEKNKLFGEQSATIVWGELEKYNNKPLIWSIFPFHPYQKGNTATNRVPNQAELELGYELLKELLSFFSIEYIAAAGRKSEKMIRNIGIPFVYVRHPANGGKNQFAEQIQTIIKQ